MALDEYDLGISVDHWFDTLDSDLARIAQSLPRARLMLKAGEDPQHFNFVRIRLDGVIASAFAQRNAAGFAQAFKLSREHKPAFNTRPPPWKELYTNLLSLLIVTGPMSEAAEVAAEVRNAPVFLQSGLDAYQAEMLSGFISLERNVVAKVCDDLLKGVEERLFSKGTAKAAQSWVTAGRAIIDRNGDSLKTALCDLATEKRKYVIKGAKDLLKDVQSDFDVQDFLMAPEGALQAIGESAGLLEQNTISPYFDIDWIRKAA